jgi:cell division protein FtsA
MDQVAFDRFRLPVRVDKPEGVAGLVDVVASTTHATAVGLVRNGMMQSGGYRAPIRREERDGGLITSIRNILKDFF